MRVTRRGYGLLAVVVVAEILALTYGARSLDAIVAPAVVALGAAVVQVRRGETPTAERESVTPGFPGDTRTVTVTVDGGGVAHIAETVPEGLTVEDATVDATLPTTVSSTVTYVARGRHTLGPLDVRVRDVLGLVERQYRVGATSDVLVYPPVYRIGGDAVVRRHVLDRSGVERGEFDTVREYVPGDPLRDVHWKSTAKAGDGMYVAEFADSRADDEFVIAASAEEGSVDRMAAAAASVAVTAVDAGLSVELRLPDGTVPPGQGVDHRQRLLTMLAETGADTSTGPYALPEGSTDGADVVVRGDADGVTVTFGADTRSFEEITVDRDNSTPPAATGEVKL